VITDWACADYRWRNGLGFRAGIIRQAHGLYNETREIDMLRTAILLPEGVYAENTRDFFSRLQGISPLTHPRSMGGFSYPLNTLFTPLTYIYIL
jgi:hypothetical protein